MSHWRSGGFVLPSASSKQNVGLTSCAQVRDTITTKDDDMVVHLLRLQGLLLKLGSRFLNGDGLVVAVRRLVPVGDDPLTIINLAVVGQNLDVGSLFLAKSPTQVIADHNIQSTGEDGERDLLRIQVSVDFLECGVELDRLEKFQSLGVSQVYVAPPLIHGLANSEGGRAVSIPRLEPQIKKRGG